MTPTPVTRTLALLAAGAFALTACGGEDTLTKEEFIAQGDAICQELEDASNELPEPEAPEDVAELIDGLAPLGQGARDRLAALSPPEDGVAARDGLVSTFDAQLAALRSAQELVGDDPEAAIEELSMFEPPVEGDQLARDYGFQVCGNEE